jgi:hypothetical protein
MKLNQQIDLWNVYNAFEISVIVEYFYNLFIFA